MTLPWARVQRLMPNQEASLPGAAASSTHCTSGTRLILVYLQWRLQATAPASGQARSIVTSAASRDHLPDKLDQLQEISRVSLDSLIAVEYVIDS